MSPLDHGTLYQKWILPAVWQNVFLGRSNIHVYLPQIGNTQQTRVKIPPKSKHWWTMRFYWGTYRTMSERFLSGVSSLSNLLNKQPHHQGTHHHRDSSQSWEPEAHCRELNRLESVLPTCLSWSKPLPGSWYSIRVSFAT